MELAELAARLRETGPVLEWTGLSEIEAQDQLQANGFPRSSAEQAVRLAGEHGGYTGLATAVICEGGLFTITDLGLCVQHAPRELPPETVQDNDCPACGAGSGQPCVSESGQRFTSVVHAARIRP